MDRTTLVHDFIQVTQQSEENATFYLEAANWNLENALASFFETENKPTTEPPSSSNSIQTSSTSNPSTFIPSSSSSSSSSSRSSRFATLSQLKESKSDDSKNTYFAGGQNSGVAIQGPKDEKKKSTPLSLVDEILSQAQANGPRPPRFPKGSEIHGQTTDDPNYGGEDYSDDVDEEDNEEEEETEKKKKPTYFTGSGYRLGSETEPSKPILVSSSSSPSSSSTSESNEKLKKVVRTLTFWKNGFSIDDGPLYKYDDPQNQSILDAIKSGRAPVSILNVHHGQPVDLRVAQKMDQEFVPPPPKPFSGSGQRLGSVVPSIIQTSSSSSSSSSTSSTPSHSPPFQVDETQPVTTLQIRLTDGTRLVAKFNHSHTIRDVRAFVAHSRPESRPFILQTTFPVTTLQDEQKTLKEAGLLNCALLQKLI